MARDWLMASIDARQDAAANASEAMAAVVEKLDRTRTSCSREVALVGIVDERIASGARDLRRSAARTIERYERAMLVFRGNLVLHMTEDEGLIVADAARDRRISRRRAGRVHATAIEGA
jgi:hypothetical protein